MTPARTDAPALVIHPIERRDLAREFAAALASPSARSEARAMRDCDVPLPQQEQQAVAE